MASEILGLFGTQNPQQLQQDYLSNLMVSPAQMGSQGLLQQLISTGANAGTMMGYGAGRLLGGKVAGEVEANYLDQAIQYGAKGKTPVEKMSLVAEYLSDKPGMGAQYMKAMEEARNMEYKELQMKKTSQDLNPPYKDFKVETIDYKSDGLGGLVPVRTFITVTRKYNPETGEYEDMTPQEARDAGVGGGGGGAPPMTIAQQAAAELERRKNEGTYTNPVPTPNMPPANTIPPAGSRGMTRGFEGQGMINPEGF